MTRIRLFLWPAAMLVLGGCAVPHTPDTPISQRYHVDQASGRGYYIYVPSTYDRRRPAPLIVTCHGTPPYDVAEHHIREWKWYAEQHGCIVVAPALQATDGIFGDGPIVGMLECERRILSLIGTLGYQYNLDLANVMITGFSGGGFPTYWVGLRHPDLFSAVVARNCNFSRSNLDGWFPPEAARTPVFVYWGENDAGAIRRQSQEAVEYLRSKSFTVETMVVPGAGHARHPEHAMEFFRKHWRTPRPSLPP